MTQKSNRIRRFSSYGPVNTESHYYAPRTALIDLACTQLVEERPDEGGLYFTIWAPRQTGKTWISHQALFRIREDERFHVVKCNLQVPGIEDRFKACAQYIINDINQKTGEHIAPIKSESDFQAAFAKGSLHKPLILVLDEFDALSEDTIQRMVGIFRNIYIERGYELDRPMAEKSYLLHGLALIGVRSVLGVENVKGSPFNVQRSMHVQNLTFDEVKGMYDDYQGESGQAIDPEVIDTLFHETQGQPGLVSWFGEMLTEKNNPGCDKPIDMTVWQRTWADATRILPDNIILNIISKAKLPAYYPTVLSLFRTDQKIRFSFDNPSINFLYLNGVIDYEEAGTDASIEWFAKFSCPYVQKRLFNRFSADLYDDIDPILDPFDDMEDAITDTDLHLQPIFKRYQKWLIKNAWHLFKEVPRRKTDLKICEAVFHFNLYHYLSKLFASRKIHVYPEFPTGNGKVDLLIQRGARRYALELKSFRDSTAYKDAIKQAASYAQQLGLEQIDLLFFIDTIDENSRQRLEKDVNDTETGITVSITFIETAQGQSHREPD